MLDMAFVEEIIPVLIAESTHPTVKGITLAVISQLGLRGRAAVAAEHRIRPLVMDAIRETFGEDELEEDYEDDDELSESEDEYGFEGFEDDDDDDFGYDEDEDDDDDNDAYFMDDDDEDDLDSDLDDDDDDDLDDLDDYGDDDDD